MGSARWRRGSSIAHDRAAHAGAEADYEALLELHATKLVGTYDVVLVTKDADGKVHLEKHEKPTQHGAWGAIAVGAAVGSWPRRRSSRRRWSAA